MSLEKVVLHLGAHKTATSLIQKYMRDRAQYCEANGIAALGRGECDQLIRWGTPATLQAGKQELNRRIADAENAGARYYVISHENALGRPFVAGGNSIYPGAAEKMTALKDALSGHKLMVVYYIRAQAAFLESYYLQTIHEGAHHTFKEWRDTVGRPPLSWKPLYDTLCQAVGTDNVVLHAFEDDITAGQAGFLEKFFASFLGNLDPAAFNHFEYGPLRNPSIGDKGLAIARAANRYLETAEERSLMRKFLQKNFSNRDYKRPQLLKETQVATFTAEFTPENAELVKTSVERAAPRTEPASA